MLTTFKYTNVQLHRYSFHVTSYHMFLHAFSFNIVYQCMLQSRRYIIYLLLLKPLAKTLQNLNISIHMLIILVKPFFIKAIFDLKITRNASDILSVLLNIYLIVGLQVLFSFFQIFLKLYQLFSFDRDTTVL